MTPDTAELIARVRGFLAMDDAMGAVLTLSERDDLQDNILALCAALEASERERDGWLTTAHAWSRELKEELRESENERANCAIAFEETLAPLQEGQDYLTRLFKSLAPQCEAFEDLPGLATQIDNFIAGLRAERDALDKSNDHWAEACKRARDERDVLRRALEQIAAWEMPSTETGQPYWWHYGSQGEETVIRDIARAALSPKPEGKEKE